MGKFYFEIKEGQCGLLDDGRPFKIVSIPSIMMCTDGTLRYGDVRVEIEEIPCTIRIAEFIDHIGIIGDLTIREDKTGSLAM